MRQALPFVAVVIALLLAYRSPPAGVADTPLLAAAKVGDVDAARAALDGGAWREQYLRRYKARRAPRAAVRACARACVVWESVTDASRHVMTVQLRNTPLHEGTRNGHAGVVALLLERGAHTEVKNNVRSRAARCCARAQHRRSLLLTLCRAAPAPAPLPQAGWTPLHLGAMYGRHEAVRVLLEHGARTRTKDRVRACACVRTVSESVSQYTTRPRVLPLALTMHRCCAVCSLARGVRVRVCVCCPPVQRGRTALELAKDDATRDVLRAAAAAPPRAGRAGWLSCLLQTV
jgi:hypothetical protein